MQVALVIPCFNEEHNLAATCASLGFGLGSERSPPDTILFIVDNNSTDATVAVAQQIALTSSPNAVFLGYEGEQGYVPPRHCGNLMARNNAIMSGRSLEDTLILQVDADTQYADHYILSMKLAAQKFGPNTLIEACTAYQLAFAATYPSYVALCAELDAKFARLSVPEADDVLVDDKVCGYRLSDYFKWGGHQREYTAGGDEIHAETTRLYMRAKTQRATKRIANNAFAFHSPRRLLQDPGLQLATTGFPREASWNKQWHATNSVEWDLNRFFLPIYHQNLQDAICQREQHLLALLLVLPVHVAKAVGKETNVAIKNYNDNFSDILPLRTAYDLANRPGIFIEDAFDLLKSHGLLFLKKAI